MLGRWNHEFGFGLWRILRFFHGWLSRMVHETEISTKSQKLSHSTYCRWWFIWSIYSTRVGFSIYSKWYKISHSLRNKCTRNKPSPVWVLKSVKVVPAKSKLLMRSMITPNALAVPDDTNDPNWKTMTRCLGVSSQKVVEFLGRSNWFTSGLANCTDICKSVG